MIMGDDEHFEEPRVPIADLARKITRNYIQELTREATKRAIKSKIQSLNERRDHRIRKRSQSKV